MKMAIERVFTIVMLFLLYFACVQVVSYIILRAPLIGRQLLESKYDLGAVTLFGIPLYRVNSLAGEPRDFGTFLLGAIPFYMYVRYGKMRLLTIVNVLLMICAFFLTTSNSAFVALSPFFSCNTWRRSLSGKSTFSSAIYEICTHSAPHYIFCISYAAD